MPSKKQDLALFLVGLLATIYAAQSAMNGKWGKRGPDITDTVWFEVTIGDQAIGRIKLALYGNIAPETVRNFVELVQKPAGQRYTGSKFHRVMDDFMIQGGDFMNGNGTGLHSIDGARFEEKPSKYHYGTGWLSMANAGDMNWPHFLITVAPNTCLDGRHVIFGHVMEGMDVVRNISFAKVDSSLKPVLDVVITDCGVEKLEELDCEAELDTKCYVFV